MLPFSQELHALLSASYPYIWIQTHEEERALALLRQLASALGRQIDVWLPEGEGDPEQGFLEALDDLDVGAAGEIRVLVDAHPYILSPKVIRRLRSCATGLAERGSCAVFISPVRRTPEELRRDWCVIEMPMPDRQQLINQLDQVLPDDTFPDLAREKLAAAALGLTAREARRAFERARHHARLARAAGTVFDWETEVVREKRRLMTEGSTLEFWESGTSLSQVGGVDELKRWVLERRRAFDQEARDFGLPQPRGLLLLGVQGCGKSLAAKAVASYWGIPLLRMDIGSLFLSSAAPDDALREIFRTTEAMAPCVLWVDELEKGFSNSDESETTRLMGTLLNWLQEKSAPVFFTATANRVHALPPELLRRGRFDEIFFVDLPDETAREEILAIHLGHRVEDLDRFDLRTLAQACEHFSGAELEQVVTAGLYAAFAERRALEERDLLRAARQLVPLYALYEVEIKALRTWADGRARPASRNRKLADLFDSSSSEDT